MLGLMKRFWVVAVIVIALVAAVAVVGRLRTFFDSDRPYIAAPMPADPIKPINTKRVTYEVVGPAEASGRVSYLDVNGRTIESGFTALPWSVTVSTTDPGVLANIVAQGDTDALGCRILVNDKLVAEDYADGRDAQAFCLDKAA
ncbi:putative membrane protein, MmpS [Mycolicibacterium anyangense]|uniref:Putative membrane protein, MmpS n=1 Tax=Mycolicibacterium anyangense TaxID=1431246 RepID=A0A6N4W450_9MYCO|nr:MmpS family transport accessory protein [Mycolicibacterium anyangense]BBZ75163.1 putative membrane protein, MmpS [Mycolicibacterium anyangense]